MADTNQEQVSILIADDNTWMQRILAKILIAYGCKPLFASNAYETVALTIELRPRAVILDIVMPDVNGLQTLRLLKTISITRSIPVLMITAATDPDNIGQALRLGADGLIRKPFTRASIHERLTEVLGPGVLRDLDSSVAKIPDEHLDTLMEMGQSPLVTDQPRSRQRSHRSQLSIKPLGAEDESDNSMKQPDFSVVSRRKRHNSTAPGERPDEEIIREILRRTSRD